MSSHQSRRFADGKENSKSCRLFSRVYCHNLIMLGIATVLGFYRVKVLILCPIRIKSFLCWLPTWILFFDCPFTSLNSHSLSLPVIPCILVALLPCLRWNDKTKAKALKMKQGPTLSKTNIAQCLSYKEARNVSGIKRIEMPPA